MILALVKKPLDAINIVQRGLPQRTPLPILNGIKLEVKEDHLILTSSNTDLGIQIIVKDESLEVLATGQTVIPGKYLIDITRKLDGRVEMSLLKIKFFNSLIELNINCIHEC